ncbi:RICIN domain-containing protein [Mycobacterium sp. KBS0706]|nr:RICIN domain-containing protein [Mycobacterium sp. KBS0706]
MSNGTIVIQSGMLPDLVVSANPSGDGFVSLQWLNGNDPNQQWTMESANGGFYLRNAATGTYLAATGSDSRVILNAHGDVWQKTGPDDKFTAIRLALNTSQNLNALGAHAVVGTAIGTWGWSGGDGNEVWTISSVASVWPRPTRMQSFVSGMAAYLQLSVHPGDIAGALVVDDNFSSGAPFGNFAFTVTSWMSGFSIVNKTSGLLAYVNGYGNGARLLQRPASQMNTDAVWTYGASGTFQAIRPWADSDQNWNVFGNPHPIPKGPLGMGTWNWGGGQANEVWQTVAAAESRQVVLGAAWQPGAAATAEARAGNGHSASH